MLIQKREEKKNNVFPYYFIRPPKKSLNSFCYNGVSHLQPLVHVKLLLYHPLSVLEFTLIQKREEKKNNVFPYYFIRPPKKSLNSFCYNGVSHLQPLVHVTSA